MAAQPTRSLLSQYQPIWLPYNQAAEDLSSAYLERFGLPQTGKNGEGYRLAVASFLKNAQRVFQANRNLATDHPYYTYFGVYRSNNAWTSHPLIGKDKGKKVVDAFASKWLIQVEGSGSRGFYQNDKGEWKADPKMTLYVLDLSKLPPELADARFIEIGRPRVKINKAEARQQRERRKAKNLAKPFLKQADTKRLFGGVLTAAESRIEALNAFWLAHPLLLPEGHAAACATRVYHDGRMDAGGRLYGYWTGRDKHLRLGSTIDKQPTCEIDIRASQPTLLNSLMGYRLQGLAADNTWQDVYAELSKLWAYGVEMTRQDRGIDQIDFIKRSRRIAKAVVMEMIGTGNPDKARPSEKLKTNEAVSDQEWNLFLGHLKKAIPALAEMEPRYSSNGDLTGYLNGPGFLSYHESEMTLQTLEHLRDEGIPAYPVHDCLIVKISDAERTASVFRDTIDQYCYKLAGLRVKVPLSFETREEDTYRLQSLRDSDLSIGSYPL